LIGLALLCAVLKFALSPWTRGSVFPSLGEVNARQRTQRLTELADEAIAARSEGRILPPQVESYRD
jgi:hypothetical protein